MKALRECQHANIVQFKHSFSERQCWYVVTELCDTTLHKKLIRHVKLTEEETLKIMGQLLEGYAHLRSKGYIHRDLKPENLFI